MDVVNDMLANDIARLMVMVCQEESLMPCQAAKGRALDGTINRPFGHNYCEGGRQGHLMTLSEWWTRTSPPKKSSFTWLSPVNCKVLSARAKKEMVKSKLHDTVLGNVWKLADVHQDRLLDDEDCALDSHFIKDKLEGDRLPSDLPQDLIDL